MKKLYTATATVTGGRDGHGTTSDGKLDLALSKPKELTGVVGEGTNPEQLFAIGFSACFLSAIEHVAKQRKVDVGDAKITGNVDLGLGEDGGFELGVELRCNLPGVSKEEAQSIVDEAKGVCPYSKATRGNIEMKAVVE